MSYIDKDATLAAIAQKAKDELADVNHYFLEGVQLAVDVVEGMPEPKEAENGSVPCPDARNSHDRTTDDCISRQAAIDATWFEPSYTDPLNVLTEVRDRLKALPPAQPEGPDSLVKDSQCLAKDLVNDCISRQAAITQLSHNKNKGDDEWELAVQNDIQTIWKLPATQPETHDKRAEMHACDLISRQALCEYALNQKDKNITANDIMRFPSAQPKSYREGYQAGYKDAQFKNAKRTAETAQNVSDEDLISRKAAMNRIDEALSRVFVDSHGCGETVLRKLPSVKPERNRGHWVGIDDEPYETWECDQCGCIQECFEDELPNYCSNCGAKMEVNDERSD